jgi:hypothetical protein
MRYVGNTHIEDCVHVVDALLGPEDDEAPARGAASVRNA